MNFLSKKCLRRQKNGWISLFRRLYSTTKGTVVQKKYDPNTSWVYQKVCYAYLAKRFVRIIHFGFLSSSWKRTNLPELQCKLRGRPFTFSPIAIEESHHKSCPSCKTGKMIPILTFGRRGPRNEYNKAGFENSTCAISIWCWVRWLTDLA